MKRWVRSAGLMSADALPKLWQNVTLRPMLDTTA
jgi:hypothetical protein